jgi:hypothetical protein
LHQSLDKIKKPTKSQLNSIDFLGKDTNKQTKIGN